MPTTKSRWAFSPARAARLPGVTVTTCQTEAMQLSTLLQSMLHPNSPPLPGHLWDGFSMTSR